MARGRPKKVVVEPEKSNPRAFEAPLWAAADKLRGNMDAAEYKHVALGLIFLKYISDRFNERRNEIASDASIPDVLRDELLEEKDSYTAESVFWVPEHARWEYLKENATSTKPTIGELIDTAMIAIESENPTLKGVLTKNYARPELDQTKLAEVVKLFSDLAFRDAHHGQDVLGRVYDPCCGSGGMFVQSEQFIEAHEGGRNDISIYGQESNPTTWRLAKMNLAIRGIESNLGSKWADSFHEDMHPSIKADYILANPPFNQSDWGQEKLQGDVRWQFGTPPAGNANFGWVQHIYHHLAPHGIAGFVLANGSLSSQQSGEGEIRQRLIEKDVIDCIVALPGQLFSTTQIPVCLWFVARDKSNGIVKDKKLRDRRGDVLFIDARNIGTMVTRTLKELTDQDVATIADTYHAWREKNGQYEDVPGFAKSVKIDDIAAKRFVLTPGMYVEQVARTADSEAFPDKMARLTATLKTQMERGNTLDMEIRSQLKKVGYGW